MRKLLIECYVAKDDTRSIVDNFDPPEGNTEIVYLADALWAEKRVAQLKLLLSSDMVAQSTDPSVLEVKRKYTQRI